MTVLENTSFWLRELAPVDWTTSQFPAIIGARSRPPVGDEGCRLGGGVNLSVRDATQTIPTFRSGFSRTSRVVGRPADYRRFLSAVVGVGDRYPDRAAYYELYRAVFRRFGGCRGNRDGFGRALWTSELRGLSSSVEQDCGRLDTRADAYLFLSHILA